VLYGIIISPVIAAFIPFQFLRYFKDVHVEGVELEHMGQQTSLGKISRTVDITRTHSITDS
jgi:hypothetical protein